MRTRIPLFLLLSLFAACNSGKDKTPEPTEPPNSFSDDTLVHIVTLQHERNGAALMRFLKHPNVDYQMWAASAFASIQDSNAVPGLIEILSNTVPAIASNAAHALGQIGHPSASKALMDNGLNGLDESVSTDALEALGKCGTKSDLDSLIAHAAEGPIQGVMAACYRFGARGILSPETEELALEAIETGGKGQLYACAFLGRMRDLGPVKDPKRLAKAFNSLKDAELRLHLVRRLGHCTAPECKSLLHSIVQDAHEDRRVRVNAIRAFGTMAPETVPPSIWTAAADTAEPHVAYEAALYLKTHGKPEDSQRCKGLGDMHSDWRAASTLYAAAIHIEPNPTKSMDLQAKALSNLNATPNFYAKGHWYLALAESEFSFPILRDSLLPIRPVVSTYIMDGLTALYTAHPENPSAWIPLMREAVASGDVALIAQAALLLREEGLANHVGDTTFLHDALAQLKMPRDIETYNEVRKTLNQLAGKPDAPLAPAPAAAPIDWALVKTIPYEQIWRLETNKGIIDIQLEVVPAPATVGNIVRLTREGYFDGKTFHRVVPNFVAQAGCPRGDGWGSVEPMIRSEFGFLPFTRGAVGMASAGKDTESCQFFITHSATPHLDGRYTVFGYVVEGMEVVDKLNIGDRIIKASLPEAK